MKCPKCKTGFLVTDHNGYGGTLVEAVKCELCGWRVEKDVAPAVIKE